jgi:hypothetical protein
MGASNHGAMAHTTPMAHAPVHACTPSTPEHQSHQQAHPPTQLVPTCPQLLFKPLCEVSEVSGRHKGLTLGEVDQLLQQLVEEKDKSRVLGCLMQRTTHQQMRWIAAIILHDVKVRLGWWLGRGLLGWQAHWSCVAVPAAHQLLQLLPWPAPKHHGQGQAC